MFCLNLNQNESNWMVKWSRQNFLLFDFPCLIAVDCLDLSSFKCHSLSYFALFYMVSQDLIHVDLKLAVKRLFEVKNVFFFWICTAFKFFLFIYFDFRISMNSKRKCHFNFGNHQFNAAKFMFFAFHRFVFHSIFPSHIFTFSIKG